MKTIYKVGLAVFKDGKVLMARSRDRDVFYCVGGKIEEGESEIDCLHRETMEEIASEIDAESIRFLKEFEDVAHGKVNTQVNIKLYEGKLTDEPIASDEIVEIQYLDSSADPKILAPIDIQIFAWLKEKGYII